MTFKNLMLKKSYSSEKDKLLESFYIPVLENAIEYKRIAGYFSSNTFAVAAKGFSKFFNNGGHMKMIVNVVLRPKDYEEIKKSLKNPEEIIEKIMLKDIADIENACIKDHVGLLGFMLATKKLEIKVGYIKDPKTTMDILHQKVGIIKDEEGNKISFSGSNNETKNGWLLNSEKFKVFCSWNPGTEEYISQDIEDFDEMWNNNSKKTEVIPFSKAVEKKIITIAPKNKKELKLVEERISEKEKSLEEEAIEDMEKITPFYYQREAIDEWFSKKNKGFFEMATGTGKTITGIIATKELIKKNPNLGVIIVVPGKTLISQWKKELIEKGDFKDSNIVLFAQEKEWKKRFERYALLNSKGTKFFISTYKSLSNEEIQKIISKSKKEFLIICDEMHHAGAPSYSKTLNPMIKYRLGLSATPIRKYDVEGNEILLNYFGEKATYSFNIERALKEINPQTGKTYLCPYKYYFKTTELTDSEHKEYRELSKKIFIQKHTGEEENEGQADKIRALLVSCSYRKLNLLDSVIKDIKERKMAKKTLFYCQGHEVRDTGETQIEHVKKIINQNGLSSLDFTSKFHDAVYREKILNALTSNTVDAIVSMKCLDEGIDLPEVRTAILLANSTNSTEFIQRRGRILRNSKGKKKAEIYDFLVGPPLNIELKASDISLIRREYNRAKEYSLHSLNCEESTKSLNKWLINYDLEEKDLLQEEKLNND
jgi:superfamily II DNA or RNA helicase